MQWAIEETICAIASAFQPAPRGVIRISGPDTIRVIEQLLGRQAFQNDSSKTPPHSTNHPSPDTAYSATTHELQSLAVTKSSRRWLVKVWIDQLASRLDIAIYLWPTTASYTGQPSAELHMIGSPPILQSVIEELTQLGCRLAQPGEFTMRAFFAGRLDLAQCEAVLGVIHSETESQFESSLQQLSGGIDIPVQGIRQRLIGVLAELEAGLDFVDEDIEFISDENVVLRLNEESNAIDRLLNQLKSRSLATNQPKVVLVGLPNAGKSTLFNTLLSTTSSTSNALKQNGKPNCSESYDRSYGAAIVSSIAGSTRDYLTTPVQLESGIIELNDTAGMKAIDIQSSLDDQPNETVDGLHSKSQHQTIARRDVADLVLYCVDATLADRDFRHELQQAANMAEHVSNMWLLLTKIDSLEDSEKAECTKTAHDSLPDRKVVLTGDFEYCGEQLQTQLNQWLIDFSSKSTELLATTSVRCIAAAEAAKTAITRAKEAAEQQLGHELVSAEIRLALHELGVVAGEVHNEEILDNLFSQFCIGK